MNFDLSVIRGRYLEDILDQPRALRATWEGLRNGDALAGIAGLIGGRKFERIVLTGMGSSFFGLHPLAIEAAEHGWSPILLETSELLHYYPQLLNETTLVIAVSQSGQSAETLRLLERRGSGGAVVAVTNTAGSPLAKQADAAVLTSAGDEFSVSCKTYVSSLMALSMVGAWICGRSASLRLEELASAADAAETYVRDWTAHVSELCERLRDIKHLFLVGRGASLAAAGTGALIIKESDHFHAEGLSSAAFRHGPFEMLGGDSFVGVFGGDPRTRELNQKLLHDVRETGARTAWIADDSDRAFRIPNVPAVVRPIVEILPVQMITLALAALANREPGKFERATKITAVE